MRLAFLVAICGLVLMGGAIFGVWRGVRRPPAAAANSLTRILADPEFLALSLDERAELLGRAYKNLCKSEPADPMCMHKP